MRPVRLGASALDDIEAQIPTDRLDQFRSHDLRPVLEALSKDEAIWDEIGVPQGPGRRITLAGQTVAGFHLFIAEDPADPRPGALVVFAADVWLDHFPG